MNKTVTAQISRPRGPEERRAAGVEKRPEGRVPRAQSAVASPGRRPPETGASDVHRTPVRAGAGSTAEAGRPSISVGVAPRGGTATRQPAMRDGSERRAGVVAAHRQSGAGRRARAQSPAKPRGARGEWQSPHGQENPSNHGATPHLQGRRGSSHPPSWGGGAISASRTGKSAFGPSLGHAPCRAFPVRRPLAGSAHGRAVRLSPDWGRRGA